MNQAVYARYWLLPPEIQPKMNQGRDYDEPSPVTEKFSEDKVIPSVLDTDEVSIRSLAVQDPVLTARGLTFDEGTCMDYFLYYSY